MTPTSPSPGSTTTAYHMAEHFLGVKEMPGIAGSAVIVSMLQLEDPTIHDDETPWCSAFVNTIAFLCDLGRSRSLAARSWLKVGTPVALDDAERGYDIVILKRGSNAPGPDVLHAPGHVAFFSWYDKANKVVHLLGGNQGDSVSVAAFPVDRVLGVRHLVKEESV